jgi:mannose-6-phosphate isomerase-like protein (cupin superfamily)
MRVITGAGAFTRHGAGLAADWIEHLRVANLSVGTYSIPAGGIDEQEPHSEDEIYIVTTGRATLESGADRAEVGPGSVIYVPAGEEHRFAGITEDLTTIVVFAPAEYTNSGTVPSAPAG